MGIYVRAEHFAGLQVVWRPLSAVAWRAHLTAADLTVHKEPQKKKARKKNQDFVARAVVDQAQVADAMHQRQGRSGW